MSNIINKKAVILAIVAFTVMPVFAFAQTVAVPPFTTGGQSGATVGSDSTSVPPTTGGQTGATPSPAPTVSPSPSPSTSPVTTGGQNGGTSGLTTTGGQDGGTGASAPVITTTTGGGNNGVGSFSGGGAVGGGSPYYSGNSTLATTTTATTTVATTTAPALVTLIGAPISAGSHFACPLLTGYVFQNTNNNPQNVNKLQAFLKIEGGAPGLQITGVYDAATIAAVDAFQKTYLISVMGPWGATQPSGEVYITTTKKINEIACDITIPLTAADIAIINAYKANEAAGNIGNSASMTGENGATDSMTSSTSVGSGIIGDNATATDTSVLVANVPTNGLSSIGHFFASIFGAIGHFFGKK